MQPKFASENKTAYPKKVRGLSRLAASYQHLNTLLSTSPDIINQPATKTIHVLHLEDGLPERFFVRELLRRKPGRNTVFEITHVTRMFGALNALERHHFDLVLADLQLPDTTGLETVMALRAAAPNIPIVLHSGVTDPDFFKGVNLWGIQGHIVKGQENPETFHTLLHETVCSSYRQSAFGGYHAC